MEINRTRRLDGDQYYPQSTSKNQIFLHHTAGTTADGAISWWNQTPAHVGTAYVIDRDGTVFEVFDPSKWAYHIGVRGDNNHVEKHGIGIEIVSAGQVYLRPDNKYFFYPLFPNKSAKTRIPNEDVEAVIKDGETKYYHKYSDNQVKSVNNLIKYLCCKFNIPIQKNFKDFYKFDDSGKVLKGEGGIYSHTTVRRDKIDVIPFPYFVKSITKGFSEIKKSREMSNRKKKRK